MNASSALEKLTGSEVSNVVRTVEEVMPMGLGSPEIRVGGGLLKITLGCKKFLSVCEHLAARRDFCESISDI